MTERGSAVISLREISAETVRRITDLAVAPDQRGFVASNAVSLAEALFAPEAWYRAVYAGEDPAGFAMLYDETLRPVPPEKPRAELWRFMIDARFQGRGIGAAALEQIIAHVRAKQRFTALQLSYVPGAGNPSGFYFKHGFVTTGRMDGHEIVLELPLHL